MAYQISYLLSAPEISQLVRAQYAALYGGWRFCVRTAIGLILFPTSLLSLIRLLAMEGHTEARQLLLPLLLVELIVAVLLLFHRPVVLFLQARAIRKNALGQEASYCLSDEGVSGNRFGTTLPLAWAHFQKLLVRKDGLFLLVAKNNGHWLPRDAFASEQDWMHATQMASARWQQARRP